MKIENKMVKDRLKLIRKSHKLTQNEIAVKIGTTQASYARYENGITSIPSNILKNICNELNVSSDFILFGNSKDKDRLETMMKLQQNTNVEVKLIDGNLTTTIQTPLLDFVG